MLSVCGPLDQKGSTSGVVTGRSSAIAVIQASAIVRPLHTTLLSFARRPA